MTTIIPTITTFPINSAPIYRDTLTMLVDFARTYRSELAFRTAVTGDGNNVVAVPNANRRIYARLGSNDGPVAEARIDSFMPTNNDAILLRQERVMGLGGWLVVSWQQGPDAPCVS